MSDDDIIILHNEYCAQTDNLDGIIYPMNEFDEIMDGVEPWEIARACFYGKIFCPVDDYFYFNAYGNLESINDIFGKDSPIYIDDIVQYILDNNNYLGNMEIEEILNC